MPRTEQLPQPEIDVDADEVRRARRQVVLDALAEAAELRARLYPRQVALARARSVLHNRTTRG